MVLYNVAIFLVNSIAKTSVIQAPNTAVHPSGPITTLVTISSFMGDGYLALGLYG